MKLKLKKTGIIALYVFGLGGSFASYTANNGVQAEDSAGTKVKQEVCGIKCCAPRKGGCSIFLSNC